MCGICGKLEFDFSCRVGEPLISGMMDAISHRGPDGRGSYVSGPVGLGHTRLAIIDLSTGDQPISNEDGSVWIVFNGEIYNYQELRNLLLEKGHRFSTSGDTEVIVHLYEEYGVDCLRMLRGMFAFALWDARKCSLFLARDRLGIKPLYYHRTSKALVFGSEIKALLADPDVECRVNLQSVDKCLTHFCLPGKETLWQGISKLEPGHYLLVEANKVSIREYWDLAYAERTGGRSFDDAAEELRYLVKKVVKDHMISDVPVGFLLSGGVDSTIVLSCAAEANGRKLSTYTVGFGDGECEDERPYARLAAGVYGTDHHEITISPGEFWDFLPSLVRSMEEPICDPPAVSLHYISQVARNDVKVLLSGEGGDEAFGGYHDYRNFLMIEKLKRAMPCFNKALSRVMVGARSCGFERAGKFAPNILTSPRDYYFSRTASPFSYFNQNKSNLYTPEFQESVRPVQSISMIAELFDKVCSQPLLNQLQYIDTKTSLPDDLLVKADRMTMRNALELRVPFLDHELMEFAASLPVSYRVKGLQTKRILKKAFEREIPRQIIERKKAGFPIPITSWMRTKFQDGVRDLLLSQTALDRGLFQRNAIEKLLAGESSKGPVAKEIFSLVTLELLFREFAGN